MNTDTNSTDTNSTSAAVTIAEIAEFLRHLRALSQPAAAGPTRDAGDARAERAAFLAGKADLFARIAAAHPDLVPAPPAPPATAPPATAPPATAPPATARPGEGSP